MSDPPSDSQSRPRDGDRKRAVEAIDSAYAEGRIAAADRALRVANVKSAATLGELDLVVRDLKLEPGEVAPRMVPPPPAPPAPLPPPPAPAQTPLSDLPSPPAQGQAYGISFGPGQGFRITSRRPSRWGMKGGLAGLVVLIMMISVGASLFMATVNDGGGSGVSPEDPFQFPENTIDPTDPASLESPAAPVDKLAFTEAGLRWFMARYADKFGTTRTLRLTLWNDRASVDRPVHGGRRHETWSYSGGEFEKFGSVTTNSPGTAVSDLRDLRLKALVANIARAKRTLNVEKPETIYVIIANDSLGDGPEAHIYVTNKYNETGYLATTFGGRVVRSYPFQR